MPLAVIAGSGAPLLAAVYFDRVGDYDGAFIALGVLWLVAAGMLLAARPPELPPRLAKVTTRPERLTAAAMPHGRGGPPSEREQLDPAAPGPGDEA